MRHWDPTGDRWLPDRETALYGTEVGTGVLSAGPRSLDWNGKPLVRVPEARFSFWEYYYAGGFVFVRLADRSSEPPVNQFLAIPWNPDDGKRAGLSRAVPVDLRLAKEFVYAFGQLGDKVVLATNSGGFYEFDVARKRWRCLIEPDTKTSFQIYTMLNHRDKLWLGQYPTGNLFEYDGKSVRHLKGAPPAWRGRSGAGGADPCDLCGRSLLRGVALG